MCFIKKCYFDELWFGNHYYIGNVDILNDSENKFFLKKVDYKNRLICNSLIKGAELYEIKVGNKSFKVAIKEVVKDIHIIAYLSFWSFNKAVKLSNSKERIRNQKILEENIIANMPKEKPSKYVIYSKDLKVRYLIIKENKTYKLQKQTFDFNPDVIIDWSNDFNNMYSCAGEYLNDSCSYFDTYEKAKENVKFDE